MLPPPTPGPGPLPDDWLTLHAAVTDRLRRTMLNASPHQGNEAVASRWVTVVECVDALDQLHGSLQSASASQVGEQADAAPAAELRAVGADRPAPKQP